jgi:2-methylisocitrate lyase-like PEP mutase family enzyme
VSPRENLFKALKGREAVLAPGGWNALSAKMIEKVGFKVCFQTGGGLTGALLGMPDMGMITMTEMTNEVRHICQAVKIPVIADGDSGFGNALNAMRTVTEMENAGAAAVVIQDKIEPAIRQNGEMYPLETAVKKIRASVKGVRRGEIAVAARTDEATVRSVIKRGKAYVGAGAELLFVHGQPNGFTSADLREIAESVAVPTMVNLPLLRPEEGGRPPGSDEFRGSMAKILLFPREAINASVIASMQALKQIKRDGRPILKPEEALGTELAELLDVDRWSHLTKDFLPV